MIRFDYDKLQKILTFIDLNKHVICNNSNIYNILIDSMHDLFVQVPESRRYTVDITVRGKVTVTVPENSELENIFDVIYDRPPDEIFNTIELKNIFIDLYFKKNNDNYVNQLRDVPYHDLINYLVRIANADADCSDYLRTRNQGDEFNYNDKRILRRLLFLALHHLYSNVQVYPNFQYLSLNLRKIQQSLQGIYSGYEIHNYQNQDKYLKGRQHCLILGDIHGDMVPVFKIFETRAINFDDLINYDIIFLGDIYDPFNNEFIIRNRDSPDYVGFNKKLTNYANCDMYLSIIFVLYLACKGARVFWILGNHDINSCSFNPGFHAMMNLLVNDVIVNDMFRIQKNLFICQKLFYNIHTYKLFLHHEPSKIYDTNEQIIRKYLIDPTTKKVAINPITNKKIVEKIIQKKLLNFESLVADNIRMNNNIGINFFQPLTGINYADMVCDVTTFKTYMIGCTCADNYYTFGKACDIKGNFLENGTKDIYGHQYDYNNVFSKMLYGFPPDENDNLILDIRDIGSISLDHTTSFYKSTASRCLGTDNLKKYDELGTIILGDNIYIKLYYFIRNKMSDYFDIIDRGNNIFQIQKKNTLENQFASIFYLLQRIQYIQYIGITEEIKTKIFTYSDVIIRNLGLDIKDKEKFPTIGDIIHFLENINQILNTAATCGVDLNKMDQILYLYHMFDITTHYADQKSIYDHYRNVFFLLNKHELINTGKVMEGNSCGRIYFIKEDNGILNLDNIDLTSCYIFKMSCIQKHIQPQIQPQQIQPQQIQPPRIFGGIKSGDNTNDHIESIKKDAVSVGDNVEQSITIDENPLVDLLYLFEYLDKNPIIEKKLYEKFFYEITYHSITDESLKSLYKKYIVEYIHKHVYNIDNLSKCESMKLKREDFDTKKYLTKILNSFNFLNIESLKHEKKKHTLLNTSKKSDLYTKPIRRKTNRSFNDNKSKVPINSIRVGGGGLPEFNIKDAIKFIYYHSSERAWETEYLVLNRNKFDENKYEIELNKDYEKYIVVSDFAFEFIQGLGLSKQLKIFIFNSIKTFKTIQEINMIIVYIQYYLHQNEIFVDKQFALNIFNSILYKLRDEGQLLLK